MTCNLVRVALRGERGYRCTALLLLITSAVCCSPEPAFHANPVAPQWVRREDPVRVQKKSENSVYISLDKADPAGLELECDEARRAIVVTAHFPYGGLLEDEVFMSVGTRLPQRIAEPGTRARRSVALPVSMESELAKASSLVVRSGRHQAVWSLAGLNAEAQWLRERCVTETTPPVPLDKAP